MKKIFLSMVLAMSSILMTFASDNDSKVVLKGTIKNYKAAAIYLRVNGDIIGDRNISIPVEDGKFSYEMDLNESKIALLMGEESFYQIILLKPGNSTHFEIDASDREYGVKITSPDGVYQNEMMNIFKSIQQIYIYRHQDWYGMAYQDLDKEIKKIDDTIEKIIDNLNEPFLKEWVSYAYRFERLRSKAGYVSIMNDTLMKARYREIMPGITFTNVVPPADYVKFDEVDINNPMMLKYSDDIEMDITHYFRLKDIYEGKDVNEGDWVEKYIDILKRITSQSLYDAFAYSAYMKYGLANEKWDNYVAEVTPKIKNPLIVDEINKLRLKRLEKEEKLRNIKNLPVPTFEMETVDGKKMTISDFNGKLVYLDMWATWCGPCKMEIPYLKEKEEKYGDKILFVSLSFDKNKKTWIDFVKNEKLTGTQVIVGDNYNNFMNHYTISGFPTFIVLGKDGKILEHNFLRPSDANFDVLLESIIQKNE